MYGENVFLGETGRDDSIWIGVRFSRMKRWLLHCPGVGVGEGGHEARGPGRRWAFISTGFRGAKFSHRIYRLRA